MFALVCFPEMFFDFIRDRNCTNLRQELRFHHGNKPMDSHEFLVPSCQEQRSVDGCRNYWVRMAGGDYLTHLVDLLCTLKCPAALREAGFHIPVMEPGDPIPTSTAENYIDIEIIEEDEYATLFGRSVLSLVVVRAIRGLHLFGWPMKMPGGLRSPEIMKRNIDLLSVDEAFLIIKGRSGDESVVKRRCQNSYFRHGNQHSERHDSESMDVSQDFRQGRTSGMSKLDVTLVKI